MTLITLARSALNSQITRELMGDRAVDIFEDFTSLQFNSGDDDDGGLGGLISGIGRRLGGFLVGIVRSGIQWLARNGWEMVVTAGFELATFDWNQADSDIEAQIAANNLQIWAAAGNLVGTGSVWLVSLGLAGLASLKFPVIAGHVAMAIAEEGGDEIRGALRNMLNQAKEAQTRNKILGTLLTARRRRWFGLESIPEAREPWTFAEWVEERVESIEDVRWRTFVEEFLEATVEAIIEVGYVVSYSIDDYFQSQRLQTQASYGPQRMVVLTPDERIEEEKTILRGPQTLIQEQIQTVQANHLWIHNRDVGQVVGQPAGDWIKAGIQRRRLTIVFKSKEKPPYVDPEGEGIKEVSVTIPHVDVGLTWERIKRAAKKWNWGKYRAVARLDNGRYLKCHGATEDEAEDKLRELLTLQDNEILTLSVTEEKDRHINLRKRSTMMYPAYATLVVRRAVSGDSGTTDASGQSYRQEHRRIDLWPDTEPTDFQPLL